MGCDNTSPASPTDDGPPLDRDNRPHCFLVSSSRSEHDQPSWQGTGIGGVLGSIVAAFSSCVRAASLRKPQHLHSPQYDDYVWDIRARRTFHASARHDGKCPDGKCACVL